MPFRLHPHNPSPIQAFAAVGAVLTLTVGAALAAPIKTPLTAERFDREVLPLLKTRCLGCHGVGATFAKLDLRSRETTLKGGGRGKALIPGDPSHSLLIQMVNGKRGPTMPPNGKLSPREVALLTDWVAAGVPWSEEKVESAKEQVWWSFRPVRRPAVPTPKNKAWVQTPIDAFVLAKLEANGLRPNPPAPRRILIRRAYLDMLGLPPTPEEVRAFEQDSSPNAWEKVVDRLLASPHYGERWARHWLDLVRYADSSGFEGDKDRPLAWRYRDYVINALNVDKPYDEFLKEQLAGDEMTPTPEHLIATGYLACGPQDQVQKDARTRADEMDDLVATTGSAMLGLTLGCARCHDHKYDRVSQKDYYRLSAVFAPTERREIEVPTTEEKQRIESHNAAIERDIAPLRARSADLTNRGIALAQSQGQQQPKPEQILAALPDADRKELIAVNGAVKAAETKKLEAPKALIITDKSREYGPSHLLIRGDGFHPGPEVQPGFIVALPGGEVDIPKSAAMTNTTGRRTALANWIANRDNPLTARVWMNRVWRQHFGRGIVSTPSNLGVNGDFPSHPELLDWLASSFIEGGSGQSGIRTPQSASNGWRLKPIHRLILLSNVYKQSSSQREDAMATDPQNKWVWRMPVRRLEAEAIRDSMLAVTGALNREMGGPPIYPPVDASLRADTFLGINWPEGEDGPKTWRRSIYIKVKRSLLFPNLEVFDCPEITASVAARNATTTPLQALMLLNDPLILRQASVFAERLKKEAGDDPGKQIERAYRLAFGRSPSVREMTLGMEFLRARSLVDYCHAMLNLNEFLYVQ